jgi:hypothetical protein
MIAGTPNFFALMEQMIRNCSRYFSSEVEFGGGNGAENGIKRRSGWSAKVFKTGDVLKLSAQMITPITPSSVLIEDLLESPVLKKASKEAGPCFRVRPTISPDGPARTKVLKKCPSGLASKKVVPMKTFSSLESLVKKETVWPFRNSQKKKISLQK